MGKTVETSRSTCHQYRGTHCGSPGVRDTCTVKVSCFERATAHKVRKNQKKANKRKEIRAQSAVMSQAQSKKPRLLQLFEKQTRPKAKEIANSQESQWSDCCVYPLWH